MITVLHAACPEEERIVRDPSQFSLRRKVRLVAAEVSQGLRRNEQPPPLRTASPVPLSLRSVPADTDTSLLQIVLLIRFFPGEDQASLKVLTDLNALPVMIERSRGIWKYEIKKLETYIEFLLIF